MIHHRNFVSFSVLFDSRDVGEDAEANFCENHQLNMATLRMTSDAKVGCKFLYSEFEFLSKIRVF